MVSGNSSKVGESVRLLKEMEGGLAPMWLVWLSTERGTQQEVDK
jgi:hypothetical protein